MQQIAEVAEGTWMYSWAFTMQEEVENQRDTIKMYYMMNGMCENEGVNGLNLSRMNAKTQEICPWKRKED